MEFSAYEKAMVEQAMAKYRSNSIDNRTRTAEAVFDVFDGKPYVVIHSNGRILGAYEVHKAGKLRIIMSWPLWMREKYEAPPKEPGKTRFRFGEGFSNKTPD